MHFLSNRRLGAPLPVTQSPRRSRQNAWSVVVVLIIGLAAADYWSVLPTPGTFDSPVHVVETPQTVPAMVTTSPAIETVAAADSKPAHVEAARADPSTQVANRGERAESAQRGESKSGHAHKLATRQKDEPAQSAQTIQKPVAYANRKLARRLNQEGLSLFQERQYANAAAVFAKAREAYPADAEITENLGYSLLRAGDLAAAERALLSALELAPQRATAWGSLSHIYAKRGQHREAVELLLTAYRFSSNPKKTMEVYARQAESEDDPKVRSMLAESVALLSRGH